MSSTGWSFLSQPQNDWYRALRLYSKPIFISPIISNLKNRIGNISIGLVLRHFMSYEVCFIMLIVGNL